MEIIKVVFLFILGFLFLVKGATFLIDGASWISEKFKISSLIIGLSIVAIGTSLPEWGVGIAGIIVGKVNISFGNVVGSNICNVGLVIGVALLFRKLTSTSSMLRKDFPICLIFTGLVLLFGSNCRLERYEGGIFLGLFIIYLIFLSKRDEPYVIKEKRELPKWIKTYPILGIILGIGGIGVGSWLTVVMGAKLALIIGVPETLVALTMIAVGTSLPELVTSVVAMIKGEEELSLGNVLGSNITNITLVLGTVGISSPLKIARRLVSVDGWIMLGYIVLLWMLMWKKKVGKCEGIILLGGYIFYFIYLYSISP
jgi:cation:H+ antiporter